MKVLPVFKAVVVSSGSIFLTLLVLLGTVKSAVDRQCWFSFDTFFWPDIFYQFCLGLVHYTGKIFQTFTSPEVLPQSLKPRLFKANATHKIQPMNLGIGLMSRIPYTIHRAGALSSPPPPPPSNIHKPAADIFMVPLAHGRVWMREDLSHHYNKLD